MQWAHRAALATILLSCTSSAAIAANVDLIGADRQATHHSARPKAQKTASAPQPAQAEGSDIADGQWATDAKTG